MKRMLLAVFLSGSCLTSIGCDTWPPYRDEVGEHLSTNIEVYEEVLRTFDETNYWALLPMPDGLDALRSPEDGNPEWLSSPEWVDFSDRLTEIRGAIYRRPHTVEVSFDPSLSQNGFTYYVGYSHPFPGDPNAGTCGRSRGGARCGQCTIPMPGDWWMNYRWYPEKLDPEGQQLYEQGAIDLAELTARSDIAFEQCVSEGGGR